jgi:hypothetical protein
MMHLFMANELTTGAKWAVNKVNGTEDYSKCDYNVGVQVQLLDNDENNIKKERKP